MSTPLTLRDATAQDIQFELIRRSAFNEFDGGQVCELLLRHRTLWRAVLLDRPGFPNFTRPGRLLMGGLIKLRDLEDNIWNADTLFIYTPTPAAARELAAVFKEVPGAMPAVHEDQEETNAALGTGREEHGVLTVWWD
jgi:hypothetical protein